MKRKERDDGAQHQLHAEYERARLHAGRASGRAPGDLLEAIRSQAPQDRRLSWTVLTRTLRRMEDERYVGHAEVTQLPRVTRYWLTPGGQRLVTWLARMDSSGEPGHGMGPRSAREAVGYLIPELRYLITQTQAAAGSAVLSHRT